MSSQDPHQLIDDDDVVDPVAERRIRMVGFVAFAFVIALIAGLTYLYWPEKEEREEVLPEAQAPEQQTEQRASVPRVRFVDRTKELGIDFRHVSGASGKKLLPETMGSGVAFIDFDNDGDQDLYFVNGCSWPGDTELPGGGRLYRNDGGRFQDVTAAMKIETPGFYGMGIAVGDYDADGFDDIFLSAVGSNRLYRNLGGKGFQDVTAETGVAGSQIWSTGTAFFDHDLDGDLDLIVLNYITWSPELDLEQGFLLTGLGRAYGPPTGFAGGQIELFENDGQGRFREVAAEAGLRITDPNTGVNVAKSLALEIAFLNNDDLPDVVVANDTVRNFAFLNRGGGRFEERGSELGLAYDEGGNARGAMGIQIGDIRNNGSTAVVVGNFANEMTACYLNENRGNPFFIDEATTVGLGAATRDSLTFGVVMFDYDLDGYLDVGCANGHVEPDIEQVQSSQRHAQDPELFWNDGRRRFVQIDVEESGHDYFEPIVGRGMAYGDLDGDGDLDVVITANDGAPRVLVNELPSGNFLRLDLRSGANKVRALGARVRIKTSMGTQERLLSGAGSYLSQSEHVLTFGLGPDSVAEAVVVHWPGGVVQNLGNLPKGRHEILAPQR